MKVLIHPLVTIYINTLLTWAKCFLATYGVYPGLYDLLDTPRHDFLSAQLHLRDSTLPRLLLHQSRGPPTIRKSICSFAAPHSPSPPPDRLYVCHTTRPFFSTSVCRVTSLSVLLPTPQSVSHPISQSHCPSVQRTIRPSQTIGPPSHHSVHDSSVHHPTHQSCATSVRPPITIRPSAHHPTRSIRPSATVTPSVRHTNQSVSMSVTGHLSDFHYDSSARMSIIPHNSPYLRFNLLPSRREWGAITHDSPYTRFKPIPGIREWGAIQHDPEIP